MAKWKRRLAAIEQAAREAAAKAHEARVHALQGVVWDAETAVLAARYGSDADPETMAALKQRQREAREALDAALSERT